MKKNKFSFKKIFSTKGKQDEENNTLFEQFCSLSFRKLSDIGVKLLINSNVTPNQVTIARALIFLPLISYFFSRGDFVGNIFGVLFSVVNSIVDHIDGNLARAKSQTSKLGAWLDDSSDKIAVYVVLIGIIIGSYNSTQNNIFLFVGIFVLFFHGTIVTVSDELGKMFGENVFLDHRFRETISGNKKATIFDKIFLNMFTFNHSYLTYFFFALRYQIIIGTIFNIMPYVVYYWFAAFALRSLFLHLVCANILSERKTNNLFINELKIRYLKKVGQYD